MTATPPRRKAPRRTAERIREAALALFNRFGEPHVSTHMVAAELGISEGNLYYHYRTKESLVNALVQGYAQAHAALVAQPLPQADAGARAAWLARWLDLGWAWRFLLRDTNDLVTRNHTVELALQAARRDRLARLRDALADGLAAADATRLALAIDLELTGWIGREYLDDPRHALEDANAAAARARALAQLDWLSGLSQARRERP